MPGPIIHSTFSSLSTLPSSSRTQTPQNAKAYRQAAQLFLTRRLPEAYFTIKPVITPRNLTSTGQHHQNHSQHSIVDDNSSDGFRTNDWPGGAENNSSETAYEPAPVAHASRGTRVKVWSFYLTFLNAVVELGPEEGKLAFGSARWKDLVSKARDGSIWEDIVRDGYSGDEGSVDGEVVVNLATLLLTHSPSQTLNQQRLETFLATSPLFFCSTDNFDNSNADNNDDIKYHIQNTTAHSTASVSSTSEEATSNNKNKAPTRHNLDLALKILELYALHILPRNDEWEYAHEFLQMNGMLDDERRQAFLLALHVLKEEERLAAVRSVEKRQSNGRRRGARIDEERKEDMRRRRSGTTITATDSSASGDGSAASIAENEHTTVTPTDVSREADVVSSGTSLETRPEEKEQRRQQHHYHESDSISKDFQPTYTPTPVHAPESSSKKVPYQKQQSPSAPASSSRAFDNPLGRTKHMNPPHYQEKRKKATNNNTEDAKVTKNKNYKNDTNIFTKILSALLPFSTDGKTTPGSSILSSLFPIQNRHHPALIKSILYILAVLTGLGLLGSAAGTTLATGKGVAMAPTAGNNRRASIAMRLRLENVLRMLRDLVLWVWANVKRTVGMGVAISYV